MMDWFGCQMRSVAAVGFLIAAAGARGDTDLAARAARREDQAPRKVMVGTVVCGYPILSDTLAHRLAWMDNTVDRMSAKAHSQRPGSRLDLAVLPEYLLANGNNALIREAVTLGQVLPRIAACALRNQCYVAAPIVLRESGSAQRFSNATAFVDRRGNLLGLYRKVHPVAAAGSSVLEGGFTPGREFPVFTTDFGRVGLQTCFDLLYPDGWQALADRGAEIVALASASPETVHPKLYAVTHEYYIVSATPRDHAAIYDPMGVIADEATKSGEILVREIDLSFELLHWDARLEEGEALKREFGSRVGYDYRRPEDGGIFWSNDPTMPIGRMTAALGLKDQESELVRIRGLEDAARGGPPDQ